MDETTRRVVLIKHAEVRLVPEATAESWQLTEHGRAQCGPLAERLRPYGLTAIVTSTAAKTIETGQLVARRLGLPVDTEVGLHEHDRSNVRLVERPAFETHMAEFFAQPDALVYGRETANEAHARFKAAAERVLREYPEGTVGIVAHGTVMALLLARANELDVFELWKRLSTPAFVVARMPGWKIEEEVDQVA